MKRFLVTLILLAMSTSSYAMIIHQNDFSSNADGWSNGIWQNGRYEQAEQDLSIRYNLTDPRLGSSVDIMFDIITIGGGSWESSGSAEDFFIVIDQLVGPDLTLYDDNLANGTTTFMFSDIPTRNGVDRLRLYLDSDTTARTEKFAIDNFKIIGKLPEPGTLGIFLMGLAGVAAARRRAR